MKTDIEKVLLKSIDTFQFLLMLHKSDRHFTFMTTLVSDVNMVSLYRSCQFPSVCYRYFCTVVTSGNDVYYVIVVNVAMRVTRVTFFFPPCGYASVSEVFPVFLKLISVRNTVLFI
jgi:hypothetical protein